MKENILAEIEDHDEIGAQGFESETLIENNSVSNAAQVSDDAGEAIGELTKLTNNLDTYEAEEKQEEAFENNPSRENTALDTEKESAQIQHTKDDDDEEESEKSEASGNPKVSGIFKQVKTIDAAIDFRNDSVCIGFKSKAKGETGIEDRPIYIISEKGNNRIEKDPSQIRLAGETFVLENTEGLPSLDDRLGEEGLKEIYDSPEPPRDLFGKVTQTIDQFVDTTKERIKIMALWIFATYFTHLFSAIPYLFLHGPKGSGKSHMLNLIRLLVFNPFMVTKVTEAALGSAVKFQRGTVIIDQAEKLKQIEGLLADGYKKGGGNRVIMKGGKLVEFPTYGFKAMASNNTIPADLRDRCIVIPTKKTLNKVKYLAGSEPALPELRKNLYRNLLWKHMEVREVCKSCTQVGSREEELWTPLNVIAETLGLSLENIERIKKEFDACVCGSRNSIPIEDQMLLRALRKKAAQTNTFDLYASEILDLMKKEIPGIKVPGVQWLGGKIALYGLIEKGAKRRKTRKKLMHYTFKSSVVMDSVNRYMK